MAYKAMTSAEEKVGIIIQQMGERDSQGHGGRESQLLV
jgi:hypothetical protein